MNDLLPCPFCGSTNIVVRTRKTTIVECDECGVVIISMSQQQAMDRWNTRIFMAAEPVKPYAVKALSDLLESERVFKKHTNQRVK